MKFRINEYINTIKSRKCYIFLLFSILVSFYSCALDIPEEGFDNLAPPVITGMSRDGNNIILQFQGNNDEYYFDGYNVYVSTTYMQRVSVSSYKPVQVLGYGSATPSFPLSPEDNNPTLTRRMTLYQYYLYQSDTGDYAPMPFSSGTYYIMLCSHHRLLGVNEDGVSNQEQITF